MKHRGILPPRGGPPWLPLKSSPLDASPKMAEAVFYVDNHRMFVYTGDHFGNCENDQESFRCAERGEFRGRLRSLCTPARRAKRNATEVPFPTSPLREHRAHSVFWRSGGHVCPRIAAGIEGEIMKCECDLRAANNELHHFGIGLVAVNTTPANSPKDILLAAIPSERVVSAGHSGNISNDS